MEDYANKIQGCLFGGAIGDIWGSVYESRCDVGLIAYPDHGFITDDTQLTLATCESILESGRVGPANVAEKFSEWYAHGKLTGLGSSTLKALRDLAAGAHWALSGAKGEYSAGNGAAMRIAPIAFLLDPFSGSGRTIIRDVCRITHHNDESYLGALAVAYAIRIMLLQKSPLEEGMLKIVGEELPDCQVRDRLLLYAGMEWSVVEIARKFGSSGFVVDSVPLALYAASKVKEIGFENVMRECIKAGGDTDSVCSIAGQVSGVWTGFSGLPKHLLRMVEKEHEVGRIIRSYSSFVHKNQGLSHG